MTARKALLSVGIYPEAHDPQQAFRLAAIADANKLDFISMVDHPYRPHFLDPWTTFTLLAAKTQHVRIIPNVMCLPLRPPAVLAKAAATLDILTHGRFELALGSGGYWDPIVSYGASRLTPGQAFEALEEAIEIVRLLWGQKQPEQVAESISVGVEGTDRPHQAQASADATALGQQHTGATTVSFSGKYYQLQDAQPGPAPAHPMGIWIGSLGPRMSRLIGRAADGWIVSNIFKTPQDIIEGHKIIDESALKAGRNPAAITRWFNLWGAIQTPGTTITGQRPGALVGPVSEWVERIVDYHHELRMDAFDFWNVTEDRERQIRLFAEEVVPAVRAALNIETPA